MRPDPEAIQDYNPHRDKNYNVRFKVGDRFELRATMFLIRSTDNYLWINLPQKDAPGLEEYLADPKGTPYGNRVQRLLPKGTEIRIVAIKNFGMAGPVPFFTIGSDPIWVRADFDDTLPSVNSVIPVVYDARHFRKID